jgi:hypothetical protein
MPEIMTNEEREERLRQEVQKALSQGRSEVEVMLDQRNLLVEDVNRVSDALTELCTNMYYLVDRERYTKTAKRILHAIESGPGSGVDASDLAAMCGVMILLMRRGVEHMNEALEAVLDGKPAPWVKKGKSHA